MELRDIEIFLALAEELHFGRSAERLHVTQARVSQSIAKQERRIGGALFRRTSRRVELTSIGARLYAELKPAYQQILDGTQSAAAEAARGVHGTLKIGTMGALSQILTATNALFRGHHPGAELDFVEVQPTTPFAGLRSGEVDMALLWLPVREGDLTVGPVVSERPLVCVVGSEHPLAKRDSICMEDLGDYEVPSSQHPLPAYFEEALLPFHTPSGRPIRRGTKVATWQETLIAVSAGRVVQPIQAEAADYYPWPGVKYLPIDDAPMGRWALVWRTNAESPLVRAYVESVEGRV
ncbi:LysR family transcriptional regulator [Streptomyces sp. ISL-44]|uniref:LysR substrate-binding domain-containing protein n=1 Tax=Streptomyces sp. ISL-44 TaxID=2819184 RepID=UPI001BED163A|nr:LysR family transcriptional regulator [Streptomyces sp. ISL-44]MBT2545488.1 LysR family transcriptional regulator [Streptomyces sp. ISL-44]